MAKLSGTMMTLDFWRPTYDSFNWGSSIMIYLFVTLTFPLLIGLASSSAVSHRDLPCCADASGDFFGWGVINFSFQARYTFSTPAHQNSWGFVSFNVSNLALHDFASCYAQTNQIPNFFYGIESYSCDVPVPGNSMNFSFSRNSNLLILNQTWNCDGFVDTLSYPLCQIRFINICCSSY